MLPYTNTSSASPSPTPPPETVAIRMHSLGQFVSPAMRLYGGDKIDDLVRLTASGIYRGFRDEVIGGEEKI